VGPLLGALVTAHAVPRSGRRHGHAHDRVERLPRARRRLREDRLVAAWPWRRSPPSSW